MKKKIVHSLLGVLSGNSVQYSCTKKVRPAEKPVLLRFISHLVYMYHVFLSSVIQLTLDIFGAFPAQIQAFACAVKKVCVIPFSRKQINAKRRNDSKQCFESSFMQEKYFYYIQLSIQCFIHFFVYMSIQHIVSYGVSLKRDPLYEIISLTGIVHYKRPAFYYMR